MSEFDGVRLVEWLEERSCEMGEKHLGFHARAIRHWRDGGSPSLAEVDAVLTKLDIHLDELPDGLRPDEGGHVAELAERRRRSDARLSDEQVRLLHRIHIERGTSIRELGQVIWRQVGFASPDAAGRAIGRAFARLHLPARACYESRMIAMYNGYKRCTEIRDNGKRCEGHALADSALCWSHRYRDVARASALRNSPFVKAAA